MNDNNDNTKDKVELKDSQTEQVSSGAITTSIRCPSCGLCYGYLLDSGTYYCKMCGSTSQYNRQSS